VDLPEETSSLLSNEEAHNAPTLKRQATGKRSSISEENEGSSAPKKIIPHPRVLGGRGRMGRGRLGGKMGRGGGGRKGGGRKGGKGGGMGGMDAELDMAMMMY